MKRNVMPISKIWKIFKLINNRQAWGMVPRKEGEAMNETEPNT